MNAKIGAVILAAGGSTRLGFPKQLIHYRGKTLVRNMIEVAQGASCHPIVLVVGSDGADISQETIGTSCLNVPNPDWPGGLGTSIRAGVRAILKMEPDLKALLLLVCDQYAVDERLLRKLLETQTQNDCAIVASEYSGTIGVPAIFERSCFAELLALPDHSGAKSIILKEPARVAAVSFPAGASDIDSLEDVQALA